MNKCKRYLLVIILFLSLPLQFQYVYPAENSREERELVITTNDDRPPFSFINHENKPAGITMDIWKLWSQKTGRKVRFVLDTWFNTIEKVRNGEADIHAGIFYSDDRSEYLQFSNGYVSYSLSIMVANRLKINSIKDFQTVEIPVGVTRGYYAVEYVRKKYPFIKLKEFDTNKELIESAMRYEIMAMIVDYTVAQYYFARKDSFGVYRILEDLVTRQFRAGVKKGNTELLNFINQGFARISRDEINQIYKKWVVKKWEFPVWIKNLLIFGGMGLVFLFLILQWILLKIELKIKTRGLRHSKEIVDLINRDLIEATDTIRSQVQMMENLNNAKDEILGIVAQGLRNPIVKIKEMAEKITEEKCKKPGSEILETSGEMIELIDRLMKISNLERESYQHEMEKVDLVKFIASLKKDFKELALKKNIDCEIKVIDQPLYSFINPIHFQEVCRNLFSNAVKYSMPGGKISIELRMQEINEENRCILSFIDNGIGIKSENIPLLFHGLREVGKTGTEGEHSIGLGLAIVKRFVDLHQGSISVQSEVGKGSTFSVTLPSLTKLIRNFSNLKPSLQTGDIVLFKGVDAHLFAGSGDTVNWTHVAMVVKLPGADEPLLWESTDLMTIEDKQFKRIKAGAQLVSMQERIKTYDSDVYALRRLKYSRDENTLKRLYDFIYEVHRLPFPNDLQIIKRIIKGKLFKFLFRKRKRFKNIFCSELIAESYIRMGLLSENPPSSGYLPTDFSSKKQLAFLKDASLGPEIFMEFPEKEAGKKRNSMLRI